MPSHGYAFQQHLVQYSAATLGNMKVGSLFTIKLKDYPNYHECIDYFNSILCQYHLKVHTLKYNSNTLLIYVYHEAKLQALLNQTKIQNFLKNYGYKSFILTDTLSYLITRIKSKEFPHEIGIFLGYPLYDVIHFISNDLNYKEIGYWKVYGNQKNCHKTFQRFDCCRNEMLKLIQNGNNLESILAKVS